MVQVIQEIPKPLSGMQRFAAGLGEGISQGISDYTRMTISDKMDAMKQLRKLQMAQQAQETMASKMEALGMPVAAQLTRAGFQPQHLEKLAVEYPEFSQELMRGMGVTGKEESPYSPVDSLRQLQESIMAKNALLQPQDREAMPTEIESIQPSRKTAEEPKTLDEFRRRLAPNYDRLSLSAKAKIDQRAEREFNAATAMRKEALGREKFEYEKGTPLRTKLAKEQERLDAVRSGIRRKIAAQDEMGRLISSGEISGVMPWLIDKFGIDPLMKPESAAFKVALKENFLGNIGRVGSRPNQWIETQLMSMAPAIGRSEEANLLALEALKGDTAVDQKEIQLMDELSNKYPDDPEKILKEKNRLLDDFALEQQKKTSYNMQSVKEQIQKKNDPRAFNSLRKVTPGTPLTIEKAKVILDAFKGDKQKAINAAKQLGYSIEYVSGE